MLGWMLPSTPAEERGLPVQRRKHAERCKSSSMEPSGHAPVGRRTRQNAVAEALQIFGKSDAKNASTLEPSGLLRMRRHSTLLSLLARAARCLWLVRWASGSERAAACRSDAVSAALSLAPGDGDRSTDPVLTEATAGGARLWGSGRRVARGNRFRLLRLHGRIRREPRPHGGWRVLDQLHRREREIGGLFGFLRRLDISSAAGRGHQ